MAKNRFSKILADATNLEVTSMFVNGITGRKLPGIPSAYLETLSAWVYKFIKLCDDLKKDQISLHKTYPIETAALNWKNNKKVLFRKYDQLNDDDNSPLFIGSDLLVDNVLDVDEFEKWRQQVIDKIKNKKSNDEYSSRMLRLMRVQKRLMKLRKELCHFYSEGKRSRVIPV